MRCQRGGRRNQECALGLSVIKTLPTIEKTGDTVERTFGNVTRGRSVIRKGKKSYINNLIKPRKKEGSGGVTAKWPFLN